MKHGAAEVKNRLKQALRSAMSNDSDKPDQVTTLTLLIRALRADLGGNADIDFGSIACIMALTDTASTVRA